MDFLGGCLCVVGSLCLLGYLAVRQLSGGSSRGLSAERSIDSLNDVRRRDPDVVKVLYSAAHDGSACANGSALDGKVFTLRDWQAVKPASRCLRGELCTCLGIPILKSERPQPRTTDLRDLPSLLPVEREE